METLILAFGHKSGSGKDEAVKAIIEARSTQFTGERKVTLESMTKGIDLFDARRYAFGDEMKREVSGREHELCLQYGIPYDPNPPMDDPLCPNGKQRKLLQFYGEHMKKVMGQRYWVDKLHATLTEEKPQIALVSDLRFPIEFEWVKSQGGFVCRIDRIGYRPTLDADEQTHISETALDIYEDKDWNTIIKVADGDLPELHKDAVWVFDAMVESLRPPDMSEFENIPAPRFISPEEAKELGLPV